MPSTWHFGPGLDSFLFWSPRFHTVPRALSSLLSCFSRSMTFSHRPFCCGYVHLVAAVAMTRFRLPPNRRPSEVQRPLQILPATETPSSGVEITVAATVLGSTTASGSALLARSVPPAPNLSAGESRVTGCSPDISVMTFGVNFDPSWKKCGVSYTTHMSECDPIFFIQTVYLVS